MHKLKKLCTCSRPAAAIRLAFLLTLAATANVWGQPGQGQCCYTAPGQFRFPTIGTIRAQFGPQQVALNLMGPTMVETKPGNPIPTEMVALDLSGASPTGGGADLHLTPGTTSPGQVSGPNSFFDVFVEISLDNAPWLGGQPDVIYSGNPGNQYIPVHVTNPSLNCIPPQPGATWTGNGPIPLTSRKLNAIVGQLNNVIHTVLAPNHYKTWRIDDFTPALQPHVIVAKDQFMVDNLVLDSIFYLSNPTQKCIGAACFNVADTTDHFAWYRASGKPTLLQVDYQNQFGNSTVLIDSVKYFLTPTQKFPHNAPKLLDHYKAYRIKNPQPFTAQVQLLDQFDLADPRGPESIILLTPRYFLTPAQKNTEPVYDTLTHYVAYEFFPKRTITMNRDIQDQFGGRPIRIDSSMFVLVPTCKIGFRPPQGCTPGIPDCDSVTTDRCILICPKSDLVFTVTVKDSCGNPICDPNLWLDFSQCPARPCPGEEPTWPIVHPDSCRNGIHYFTIDAGLVDCTVCNPILFVNGKACRTIRAYFFDTNGDLCVTPVDFIPGAPCNDYDCDGVPGTAADQAIFQTHLGHCCPSPPRPCDLFHEEIRIKGCDPDKVRPGDICSVCLFVKNNLPVPDTCCMDSIVWQYGTFSATTLTWTEFCKQIYPNPLVGRPCIAPGDSAEFCCNFVIPDNQHHCVRVLKFSTCCNDTLQRNLLNDYDPYNCGRRCDTFRVPVEVPVGAIYCVTPVENLPVGWTVTYSPALIPPPVCFTQSTVVTVIICTDNAPRKGQVGCVTLKVTDPSGKVVGEATVCKRIACKLGDSNDDDGLTASDVVNTLNWVFLGTLPMSPIQCIDLNGDGTPSAADVVNELNLVFLGMYPAGLPCAP